MMTADELRARYLAYLDRCNAHDFVGIASFLGPHIPDDYLDGLLRLHGVFPDIHWNATDVVIEGQRLAARFLVTATHLGEYEGIPATRRRLQWWEYAFYEWTDGRIASYRGDGQDLLPLLS